MDEAKEQRRDFSIRKIKPPRLIHAEYEGDVLRISFIGYEDAEGQEQLLVGAQPAGKH